MFEPVWFLDSIGENFNQDMELKLSQNKNVGMIDT